MEESQKEKMNRRDFWLHKGIIVKVVTKKIGEKYYKKKGVVKVCRGSKSLFFGVTSLFFILKSYQIM